MIGVGLRQQRFRRIEISVIGALSVPRRFIRLRPLQDSAKSKSEFFEYTRCLDTRHWWLCHFLTLNIAPTYSRVMRAIFEMGISFGHTASHSPSFEQLPNPSASAC